MGGERGASWHQRPALPATAVLIMVGVVACRADVQCQGNPLRVCEAGRRIEVVFDARDSVPVSKVVRIATLVREADTLGRFPTRYAGTRPITISLVAHQRPEIDATAYAGERTIVLPVETALVWPTEALRSLLRHELTHIALGGVRRSAQLPKWFQEGFAEWVGGGLTCEGASRISVNVLTQANLLKGNDPLNAEKFETSRVGYDLYTTFFEFLEARSPGVNLTMLDSVDAYGLDVGVKLSTHADLLTLEREWRAYVFKRYSRLDEGPTC
jgi:hypothetical protein